MRVLDLFAGIGGISLAAHWAGMQTVAFCEINKFCQQMVKGQLNPDWVEPLMGFPAGWTLIDGQPF